MCLLQVEQQELAPHSRFLLEKHKMCLFSTGHHGVEGRARADGSECKFKETAAPRLLADSVPVLMSVTVYVGRFPKT